MSRQSCELLRRPALRQQNINLAQLRDNLFGLVHLLGILTSSIRLNSPLQRGPLFRGQTKYGRSNQGNFNPLSYNLIGPLEFDEYCFHS